MSQMMSFLNVKFMKEQCRMHTKDSRKAKGLSLDQLGSLISLEGALQILFRTCSNNYRNSLARSELSEKGQVFFFYIRQNLLRFTINVFLGAT